MKQLIFSVLFVWGITVSAATFEVDNSHSFVNFKVNHMGIGAVWGQFRELSGNFDLDSGQLAFTVKANSISTNNEKRDQHLKSPDFFNAKQFPVIKFKSSEVTPLGDGKYRVQGDLMLRGVTRKITVEVEKLGEGKGPGGKQRIGVEVAFQVKRSEYGMKYMLEGLGDDVWVYFNGQGVLQ